MKRTAMLLIFVICIIAACNNSDTQKPKIDTTPVLSQTNSSLRELVDTLGFHSDSISKKSEKESNLITKSDCLRCHNIKEKNIGTSYVTIAEKYPATDENYQYLTSKIIKGGKGVWGDVPMNPHPQINETDARSMVNYIFSMKGIPKP